MKISAETLIQVLPPVDGSFIFLTQLFDSPHPIVVQECFQKVLTADGWTTGILVYYKFLSTAGLKLDDRFKTFYKKN